MLLMAGSIIPFSLGNKIAGSIMFCLGWAVIGLTMYIFPFVTPQTSQMMGIRKAIWVAKIIGIILIATTPLFWFMLH